MKYLVSLSAVAMFLALLAVSRHTTLQIVVFVAWVIGGATWFSLLSKHKGFWARRKRGRSLLGDVMITLLSVVFIFVYAFFWPFWVMFGEDVFA